VQKISEAEEHAPLHAEPSRPPELRQQVHRSLGARWCDPTADLLGQFAEVESEDGLHEGLPEAYVPPEQHVDQIDDEAVYTSAPSIDLGSNHPARVDVDFSSGPSSPGKPTLSVSEAWTNVEDPLEELEVQVVEAGEDVQDMPDDDEEAAEEMQTPTAVAVVASEQEADEVSPTADYAQVDPPAAYAPSDSDRSLCELDCDDRSRDDSTLQLVQGAERQAQLDVSDEPFCMMAPP